MAQRGYDNNCKLKKKKSVFWKTDLCSTSGNNCSMFTCVIGMNFSMFIWARIFHTQNRFWSLSSFWAVREASFSTFLGSHFRSGIFSSRKSSKTEHRKVHSNYVREYRTIVSRCGTSIFFLSACQLCAAKSVTRTITYVQPFTDRRKQTKTYPSQCTTQVLVPRK